MLWWIVDVDEEYNKEKVQQTREDNQQINLVDSRTSHKQNKWTTIASIMES